MVLVRSDYNYGSCCGVPIILYCFNAILEGRLMKTILLYANEHEIRYVKTRLKFYIGFKGAYLFSVEPTIESAALVILFGCSGWRGKKGVEKLNRLYEWTPNSYALVDMESQKVHDVCEKHGVKFRSIRYIIDYDRGKVMPTGLNHFWRKFQHRRMQLKFNKWMEEHYDTGI
jgi:hypothetical protein